MAGVPRDTIMSQKEQSFLSKVQFSRKLCHAVAQLIESLRYKPQGCGFDSRWCQLNFSLT
jgi:hypothetical protein